MALVVETGSGATNSESYASVADADAYFTARAGTTTWAAASTASKEQALRDATTYLDLTYGPRWVGRRVHESQALDWPRQFISDRDGFPVDSDEIPTRIKYATIEAALMALSENLLPDIAEPGSILEEEVKVGPVEQRIKYSSRSQIKRYRKVFEYVREFLYRGRLIERS